MLSRSNLFHPIVPCTSYIFSARQAAAVGTATLMVSSARALTFTEWCINEQNSSPHSDNRTVAEDKRAW